MTRLDNLSTEVLHTLVYNLGVLSARDAVAVATTCKRLNVALLGDSHSRARAHSLMGFNRCVALRLWKGALFALTQVTENARATWLAQPCGSSHRVVAALEAQDYGDDDWKALALAMGRTGVTAAFREGDMVMGSQWQWPCRQLGVGAIVACGGRALGELAMELAEVADDKEKTCMMQVAAGMGLVDVVERLVREPAVDSSADDNLAIRRAAEAGHAECVAILLGVDGVDPSACDNEAVNAACCGGHTAAVAELLADERVDPAAGGNEPLQLAAQCGNGETVALLLSDPRVNPSAGGGDPIMLASESGHDAVVALIQSGGHLEAAVSSNAAICLAARRGNAATVAVLLKDVRVDPAANDNLAIRWAAEKGHADVVALLAADDRVDPSV
ncbi:uncharacterized protein AMSG_11061, partial [Thecamonas trahens ATCC 50062]